MKFDSALESLFIRVALERKFAATQLTQRLVHTLTLIGSRKAYMYTALTLTDKSNQVTSSYLTEGFQNLTYKVRFYVNYWI